ncbi:collagen alpha-1(I) chain-like isoform X4 [Accipiter gentilis]|uniref:collagen alpha-1(I) chain-like isoform X4 n=1 Tax=Astur gentilis TaxID=8957 RepID=UPI0021105455|nr:collagen alpha-1(I) chain-like isoform X4 [Accipiter gentilis]
MLVSWSPRPPETAAQSLAGTQERWEEAGSGRAALRQHRHLASHPRCRRLARVFGPRRGSSSPGQDGPGQLLLRLQGGSHRRRAGAERRRAADPGPQEEGETPSPPPGGTGDRQVATRHQHAPTAPPGPGPAVGAEQQKGGSRGGKRGGGRGRQGHPHPRLAHRLLCCCLWLPGAEGSVGGQTAGDTRRSKASPGDPSPLPQTPGEGADPPPRLEDIQCREPGEADRGPGRGSSQARATDSPIWEQRRRTVPLTRCGTPRQEVTWMSKDTHWAAAAGRGSAGTRSLCCCPRLGGGQGEGWDRLSRWHASSQEPPRWSR